MKSYTARNPQQVCYRLVPADIRMRSRRLLRLEANKSAVCYKLSACLMKDDCQDFVKKKIDNFHDGLNFGPGNKSFTKAKKKQHTEIG